MNAHKRVVLLVGSARRPRSTSESLGSYLQQRLAEHGFETKTALLHRAFRSEEAWTGMLAATDASDLLVLAAPLYVDSLPYLVVKAMEDIAARRQAQPPQPGQKFVPILNCGFPEAHHNDTALAICRQFARETGFEWAGGLSLGGGPAIDGRQMAEVQGMARHAVRSLDLAAGALAAGEPLPREAVEAMSRPILPARAYTLLGGWGWKRQARKFGTQKALDARPYSEA